MKKKAKSKGNNHTVTVRVETPQTAIVPVEPAAPLVAVTDNVEQALDRANKQMYFRNQLLKLIAKQIDPRDIYVYVFGTTCKKCGAKVKPSFDGVGYWCKTCRGLNAAEVNEDLGPYLSGSGCRFVLSSAGAKFEDPIIIEKRYEGTEGPYIDFEVWVTVVTGDGRCVRTMGNNPTNDDFFAKRLRYVCEQCGAVTQYGKEGPLCPVHGRCKTKKESYYLSMQEVDIPSIKQKAMTNAWNHAVRDLGFMPTIEHLRAANVDLSRLKRISFSRGSGDEGEELAPGHPQAAQGSAGSAQRGTPKAEKTGAEGVPKASSAASQSTNAATQQTAGERKPEERGEPPAEPQTTPYNGSHISEARLPVILDFVKWTSSGKGLELTFDTGAKAYVFDNRTLNEKGEKLFDLLINGIGKRCIFLTKESKTKDKREYTNVTACLQVGDREWLEDGTPVLRREPGE